MAEANGRAGGNASLRINAAAMGEYGISRFLRSPGADAERNVRGPSGAASPISPHRAPGVLGNGSRKRPR